VLDHSLLLTWLDDLLESLDPAAAEDRAPVFYSHIAETHEMGTHNAARMRIFDVQWFIPAIEYVPSLR
jgi:hypothetical protein